MTLTEFLLARITDDELLATNAIAARFATHVSTPEWNYNGNPSGAFCTGNLVIGQASSFDYSTDDPAGTDGGRFARHIVNWDPARVLIECQVKRRILDHWLLHIGWNDDRGVSAAGTEVIQFLALPYADHQDYQQEWRPL